MGDEKAKGVMGYARTCCKNCNTTITAPDWGFTGRLPSYCGACRELVNRELSRTTSQTYRDRKRQPKQPQPCAHCGETFLPQRSTAQFCSTRCRVAAHRLVSRD